MTRDEVEIAVGGKVATVMDTEGMVCYPTFSIQRRESRTNDAPASGPPATYRPE